MKELITMNNNIKKNVSRVALAGLALSGISLGAFFAPHAGAQSETPTDSPVAVSSTPNPSSDTVSNKDPQPTKDAKDADKKEKSDFEETTMGPKEEENINYIGDKAPQATFTIDQKDIPKDWKIRIDEKTGTITAESPKDIKEGDVLKINVTKTLADKTQVKMVATITLEEEKETTTTTTPTSTPREDNKNDDKAKRNAERREQLRKDAQEFGKNVNDLAKSLATQQNGKADNAEAYKAKAPHVATGGSTVSSWNIFK